MNNQDYSSIVVDTSDHRKVWLSPEIEGSDVNALTNGTGSSGVEGAAFLKLGS